MTTLRDVYNEWQSNLTFREAFKQNPEQALRDAGFSLSETDLQKVRALLKLDPSHNEKLDSRISK